MKLQPHRSKKTNTIWYRFKRYPRATILSFGLVIVLVSVLWYYIGLLYPKFRLFDSFLSELGLQKSNKYNFYSGREGGAYYSFGNSIHGIFGSNNDSIINIPTSGGAENGMNLTIEKKSFGLIQEEIINHDEQLRKNVRIVAPLFLERMHIFYRKSLFKNGKKNVQLSANLNTDILNCFSDSTININIGPVGSGTRIIASYILTLIDQQINSRLNNRIQRCNQLNETFKESFDKMKTFKKKTKRSVDLLFYMVADPFQNGKEILDAEKYELMSIDPSFVVSLNKEFGLRLRVADFKNKYDSTRNTSTLATFTYLIASKAIHESVVYKLLEKVNSHKDSIYCSLMPDSDPGKSGALFEFGFLNVFDDEYGTNFNQWMKDVFVFFLSVITLFFPVFKSVIGLRFIWQRWNINKKIDEVVSDYGNTPEDCEAAKSKFAQLKEKVIDLYGDGLLPEVHYTPLMKRIELYYKKFTIKSLSPGNGNLVIIDKGNKSLPFQPS